MLLGAIACALIGFALLVVTVQQPNDLYTWIMLVVVAFGLLLFIGDTIQKRRAPQGTTYKGDDDSDEAVETTPAVEATVESSTESVETEPSPKDENKA